MSELGGRQVFNVSVDRKGEITMTLGEIVMVITAKEANRLSLAIAAAAKSSELFTVLAKDETP